MEFIIADTMGSKGKVNGEDGKRRGRKVLRKDGGDGNGFRGGVDRSGKGGSDRSVVQSKGEGRFRGRGVGETNGHFTNSSFCGSSLFGEQSSGG